MKLIGKQIILRNIELSDTDKIIEWRNKDWVRKNFIYQSQFTREEHNNWYHDKVVLGLVRQFIICRKDNEKEIGSVYLRDIDIHHHKAEFGIFIGEEDSVKNGYGTEAAKLITQYGFTELNLHKIYLRVFVDNWQAIKCYEKAGFEKEAVFRDDVFINNSYRTMVIMGTIRNDK